jgi:hypothetical protein
MINRAVPVPGTEERICSGTVIAKCFCGYDLVRIPIELVRDPGQPAPWYHIKTGRGLCNIGIYPGQVPVAAFVNNL